MAASKIRMTVWILAVFVIFADDLSWDDVLRWEVTSEGSDSITFKFVEGSFINFSDCLCNLTTASCEAWRNSNHRVGLIYQYTLHRDEIASDNYSNRYICEMRQRYSYYLSCRRMQFVENRCSNTSHCWTLYVNNQEESQTCGFKFVQIIWNLTQQIGEMYRNATVVDIKTSCQTGCSIINLVSTTTSSIINLVSTTTSSIINHVSTTTSIATNTTQTTHISTIPSTSTEIPFDNQTNAARVNGHKGNVASVITGAVVGFIVVVAILVVLGVLYWKRRRKALTGKRTSTNLNELSVTSNSYSVAFQDVKEKKPGQNRSNTSSSDYATIDPARKTILNGAASFSNEEDPGYYNPDAFDENHQPDNVNNGSMTTEQHGTDYYSLDNGQNGSTSSTGVEVTSTLNTVVGTHILPNDYAVIDENSCTNDNTYSVIDAYTNKDIIENDPTQNDNRRTTGTTQYEYVNPAMTGVGMEYSKLHVPARHFKDPYNVLSPSDDDVREDGSNTPTASADRAPITYSLAQPFLEKSTNHTQPVEVIDVDPPSQQPNKDKEPHVSSELTNRNGTEFSDGKRLHLKEDPSESLYNETNGRRDEYFELERNYD